MNKERIRAILSCVSVLLFITACAAQPTAPTATQPAETLPSARPTPYCPAAASYGQIEEYWPALSYVESTSESDSENEPAVVPTLPTFTWFYSIRNLLLANVDEWDNTCYPETYTLHLSSGPDYADEILIEVDNPTVERDTGKLTMTWTLTEPLELYQDYRWMMEGHARGFNIDDYFLPNLHNDSWWPPQSRYYMSTFRTGSECPSGSISIPLLNYPDDGGIMQTLNPKVTWAVDTCMPRVFWVEISTMSTFADPQNTTVFPLPENYTAVRQSNTLWFYVNYILRDCQLYYWRVTGGIGEGGSGGTREWGTPSSVQTFFVDTGHCPTPTPTNRPPTPRPTSTQTNIPPAPVNCTGLTYPVCIITPGCVWDNTSPVEAHHCQAQ